MKLTHKMIFDYHPDNKLNWDELRESEKNKFYWIPNSKKEYLNQRKLTDLDVKRIEFLNNYIKENKLTQIFSIGSGRANFEYFLKKQTKIPTTVTDYSKTIKKLKNFKIFDHIKILDAKKDFKIEKPNKTLVILSRIDTEFSDNDLDKLIQNLHNKEVIHIYFIVAQLLTLNTFFIEIKIKLLAFFKRKKLIDCGLSRSKSEFISLFSNYYNISTIDNFKSLMLSKK